MKKYSLLLENNNVKIATEDNRQYIKDRYKLGDEEINNLIFQKCKISDNMVILRTFDYHAPHECDSRIFENRKQLEEMVANQIRDCFKKDIDWKIAEIFYKGEKIDSATELFKIRWTDRLKMIDDSSKFGI